MKTRNLLAATLGFAVLACAGLAGMNDGRDSSPKMASNDKSSAVELKKTDLSLHADFNGNLQIDGPRAEMLRAGQVVELAISPGRAVERFEVRSHREPSFNSAWWHLVSMDRPFVDATLAVRDGFWAGHLRDGSDKREYSLRPIARDRLRVIEAVEEPVQCGCQGHDLPGSHEEASGGVASQEGLNCSGCTSLSADVAFFITSLALEVEEEELKKAGGDPDDALGILGGLAQLECANTTLAMENTDLTYEVRLVYVGVVESDEDVPAEGGLLGAFASLADGEMDEIHEIRDKFRADGCSLVTNNPPAEGAAGIAQVSGAFNVLMRSSLGYSLHAHEFGHNVGMLHAYGDGPPGFDCESSDIDDVCRMPCETLDTGEFNYGWRWTGSTSSCWRTVMAYGPGFGLLTYSNPDVVYDGEPTGVPIGEPHQADGASLFRNQFFIMSSRRCELPEYEADEDRLTAAGGREYDFFGISVAGTPDYFVGGASGSDVLGDDSGAAYIFAFRDAEPGDPSDPNDDLPERWEESGKIVPKFIRPGDRFGEAVAMDEEFLVVGSPRAGIWDTEVDDDGNEVDVEVVNNAGEVSVWVWNPFDEEYCLIQRIQPTDLRDNDWFGTSVAIHDGVIAIGVPRHDSAEDVADNIGAVHVYTYNSGVFLPTDIFTGNSEQGKLGTSVAVSSSSLNDERYIIAGAPEANDDRGLVQAWVGFGPEVWTEVDSIAESSDDAGRFGQSVALHDRLAVIGAPEVEGGIGEAYVLGWNGAEWDDAQVLRFEGDESEARFGASVDTDGARVAVGAPQTDSPLLERLGSVQIYELLPSGSWAMTDILRPLELRAGDELGMSVAIVGNLVFAGAPDADDDGILSGVVYAMETELEDCNGNSIDDTIDIYLGDSQDLNGNGIPDECESLGCEADGNGDGVVNGQDLGLLFAAWGSCPLVEDCPYDLNNDLVVDGADVGVFFSSWGATCEP